MQKNNKNNTKDTIRELLGDIDIEKEYNDSLEVFSGNLVGFLEAESEIVLDILEDYNDVLFVLLSSIKNFKKGLEHALYQNLEKITHKTFVLDKKMRAPSVRNWLRDFIGKHGSGNFNNVILSQYMTNSANVKRLDINEQKLVTKLLVLYRNIKFFPESMSSNTGEEWEIIPIDDGEDDKLGSRPALGLPRTAAEKEIDALRKEEEKYEAGGLEQMAIEEEIEEESKIEDLKIEANKYKAGSLERKALLEEIRKVEDRVVLGKRS